MSAVTPKAGVNLPYEGGPNTPAVFWRPDPQGHADPALPFRSHAAGIALQSANGDSETDWFELAVVDVTGTSRLRLGPFPADEVIALWRNMGETSGLPLMVRHADGQLEAAYDQVGRLQLGPIRVRRRIGVLKHRRPRFLTRRKTAALPPIPLIHRERELADGTRA
jgi:hypothetical protein